MTLHLRALALVALVLLLAAGSAAAQPMCGPTERVATRLGEQWDEWPVGRGLTSSGQSIVQIWTNPETGTWTVVEVRPNGLTCIIAAGTHWAMTPRPQGEPT